MDPEGAYSNDKKNGVDGDKSVSGWRGARDPLCDIDNFNGHVQR